MGRGDLSRKKASEVGVMFRVALVQSLLGGVPVRLVEGRHLGRRERGGHSGRGREGAWSARS